MSTTGHPWPVARRCPSGPRPCRPAPPNRRWKQGLATARSNSKLRTCRSLRGGGGDVCVCTCARARARGGHRVRTDTHPAPRTERRGCVWRCGGVRVVCVLGREAWASVSERGVDVQPRSRRDPMRFPELLSPGCQKFPVLDSVIASASLVKVLHPSASFDRSYSSTSSAVVIVTLSAVGLSTVKCGAAAPSSPRPFGNDSVARSSQTAMFPAFAECSSRIKDGDRMVNLAGASKTVLLLWLWGLLRATASVSHWNPAHHASLDIAIARCDIALLCSAPVPCPPRQLCLRVPDRSVFSNHGSCRYTS